jgi:hypothetical protein
MAVMAALLSLVATARGGSAASPCDALPGPGAAFAANDNHVGVIDLYFFGSQGMPVTYYECVGSASVPLGERTAMRDGYTPMYDASPWSCTRRARLFAAVVALPDGTTQRGLTDIRTPSCADRFRVEAPARAARGHRVLVRVRDRWGIGDIATRWCVAPPGRRASCHALRLVAAQRSARRSFTPDRRGRWRFALVVGRFTVTARVAVGVRDEPVRRLPRVLTTGDSTMQGVDVALADELAGTADVISDVHPGVGLSHDNGWQAVATRQAVARHATTVVLSIGADEGWPMTARDGVQHTCCDEAWSDEYARRMRRVLNIYRRHAHVIVLTVVAPRDPDRAVIVAASNGATIRAAKGLTGVRLMRIDQRCSPKGYQETIRYRGRDVAVREPDGVHLNIVGTTIEARTAEPAIRASLRSAEP